MIAKADDLAAIFAASRAAAFGSAGVTPHTAYQFRPVEWMRDVLRIPEHTIRWSLNPGYDGHQWDGTPDPLIAALDGLAQGKDVGVEAATGTQKTYTLAAAGLLWFLACWEDALVISVAPKQDQLTLNLWKEISELWPRFHARFPEAELSQLRIRMRPGSDKWSAHGFVAGVRVEEVDRAATKAQGFHAEHMLIIFEEFPGILRAISTAFRNTCTGPHNLRLGLGNPDHQLDELHQFCVNEAGVHVRISALDHPNVVCGNASIVPGACSASSVQRLERVYGKGSRLYESRVRGISPAEAAEALIRLEWVKAAQARYRDPAYLVGLHALGVDVANSEAGDHAAIARGKGRTVLEVPSFPCPNANNLGLQVAIEMDEKGIKAEHVGVDAVGVGAGTVNKLRERGKWVQALQGGALDLPGAEDFNTWRSQAHWQLRLDLQNNEIALPDDPELALDLITPTWKAHNSKIVVESKEDIKKRLPGGRSPNKGDAVVYWNWVRSREPIAVQLGPRGLTLEQQSWHEGLGAIEPEPWKHEPQLGSDQ